MPDLAPHDDRFAGDFADASRQVLYVEDHPVNVLLMQGLLAQRPGVRLTVATSGEEAMRLAREQPAHLLLLDLHLPDCEGADLLEQMRALPGLADVPAVAVTADDDDAALAGSTFLEAWHKPLDLYATLRRLDTLLDLGSAAERAARLPAHRGERRHERMRGWF